MSDIIYHYTNLDNGFKILEPEDKNELKFLTKETNAVLKKYLGKSNIEKNDVIRDELTNIYSRYVGQSRNINIWASDISKLNDKTEMEIGIKTIIDFLNLSSKDSVDGLSEVKGILNDDRCLKNIKKNSYIISFSESEDDLNQWRLYSDNAQGLSIGFDKKMIKDISHESTLLRSFKVVYEQKEYKNLFDDIISEINLIGDHTEQFINGVTSNADLPHDMRIKIPLINQIIQLQGLAGIALSYKNSCFSSENEYRIFINPLFSNIKKILTDSIDNIKNHVATYIDNGKFFRSTQNEIIQYKVLPLPINCIKRIFIGPKNHTDEEMLRDLLLSWDYNHKIDIVKSKWTGVYY